MSVAGPLRFGISRHHGGLQLLEGANRFAEALGAALATPVRVAVAFDYGHLLRSVVGASVEIAWMPPLLHARAVGQGAVLADVPERSGRMTYRSALVVRDDSAYSRVGDLVGARIAWIDRNSASGYVFPRLHLRAAGLDLDRDFASEQFYGSPSEVCAAVARGTADLCPVFVCEAAGSDGEQALADVRRAAGSFGPRLRVLAVTDSIPPDGIVLAAEVSDELARHRQALESLHTSAAGAAALRMLLEANRLVTPTAEVLAAVARLRALAPSGTEMP
jgi:phosphonate transport system substrate-binding protein